MRTRTKGAFSNSFQRNTDYDANGAVTSVVVYASERKSDGGVDTITDAVVPQFNKLRSDGSVFVNPLNLSHDSRETNSDSLSFGPHPSWGTRVIEGPLACQWSVPPTVPSWFATRVQAAKASTLTEAYAKVGEETFQGLVTVAEARKTAKMLAHPFSQSVALIKRIHETASRYHKLPLLTKDALKVYGKDSLRQVNDARKALEAAWLEYRFGFRPVIREIQQIADAYVLSDTRFSRPTRKVGRASEKVDWVEGPVVYTAPTPSGLTSLTMSRSCEKHAKVASGVLYEITDAVSSAAIARRTGFRLSDVPAALWETMPLSFVVDRFVSVGTWLNAIVPRPGVSVKGAWTTVVTRDYNTHRIVEARIHVATPPANAYTQSGGRYLEDIRVITRDANPLLPVLPSVNYTDLNLSQMIDHAALITQRLRSLRP